MSKQLTILRPDDWHLHVRDDAIMHAVMPYTSVHYARAIIMPNLVPPVVTTADAIAYKQRIESSVPTGHQFEPLMTVYLTESTDVDDLTAGARDGIIKAVKLYPAGATTNSDSGVRDIDNVMPVLECMARIGLPLLIHGEVTHADVDIFDREAVFIDSVLEPLRRRLPDLRIVLEHITTAEGVEFVRAHETNTAATITPHHLVFNRSDIFTGGIRPHRYCLPIAKREHHRQALRGAATNADERFFLGTDSAPHTDVTKEAACGCAGVFNVLTTLPCLAAVFEQEERLHNLEGFVARNGPAFYGLPTNTESVTLVRAETPFVFPEKVATPLGDLTVFDPGFDLHWRVESAAERSAAR